MDGAVKNLGLAMRAAREMSGIDLTTMGVHVERSASHLSQIERGLKKATMPLLSEYAKRTNVRVSDLMKIAEQAEAKGCTAHQYIISLAMKALKNER